MPVHNLNKNMMECAKILLESQYHAGLVGSLLYVAYRQHIAASVPTTPSPGKDRTAVDTDTPGGGVSWSGMIVVDPAHLSKQFYMCACSSSL